MQHKENETLIDFKSSEAFKSWFIGVKSFEQREARTKDGLTLKINDPVKFNDFISSQNPRTLIVLSGSSESGKSHMGKKFLEEGRGHRFKLLHATRRYMDERQIPSDSDPLDFISTLQNEVDQRALISHVVSQFKEIVDNSSVGVAVVETIKHPWVVEMLESSDEFRTLSIFINASLSNRVVRESLKTGFGTDEMLGAVMSKDAEKEKHGNDKIPEVACLHINNDGSIYSYNNMLNALSEIALNGHSPVIGGTVEYSNSSMKKDKA